MKFLLDQGLPLLTAELLREQGLDTVHVSEIGWARAEDSKIIELAQTNDRIIITIDADYHAAGYCTYISTFPFGNLDSSCKFTGIRIRGDNYAYTK